MKIGIVTVYKGNNYGAFFQAFALKSYLESHNHEVYFVDHKARNLYVMCLKKIIKKIKNGKTKGYRFQIERLKQFTACTNELKLCTMKDAENMELIIFGSDEIWNVKRKNINKYPIFLGIGLNNPNVIAYAPSVNISEVEDFKRNSDYIKALQRFKFISVRDYHSPNVISNLLNRNDIPVVGDPTLLHSRDFYLANMKKRELGYSYILIYSYGDHLSKNIINKITTYAKQKNLKIVSILEYFDWCDCNEVVEPFEMLYYFHNAEVVITDTFHGTIFSTIFNKQFAIASKSSKKIVEYLKELNLESRVINQETSLDTLFNQEINYDEVNSVIQVKREKSKEYLAKAVK